MNRGDIFRSAEKIAERGHKPGFYVVVSRDFVAQNDDIATVVCAPVYSQLLGIRSEVLLGVDDGLPRECGIRCDFLMLMFKSKLQRFVASLPAGRIADLDAALAYALDLAT
jgi:mRNA interferase MazF